MKVLLDTHILLWWLADDSNLKQEARNIISNSTNKIYISTASVWEIYIKKSLGKLIIPADLESILAENSFQLIDIKYPHAKLAGSLPYHHADPFDRMLVAQAAIENLTLISHDKQLATYELASLLLV